MILFERLDAVPPLSPEERLLLDSVKALARDQIAKRAAEYDRSGEFPWDNIRAINALGLNAMFVPEAYGGAGLSYAAYLACVREISAACASTGIIWATNFHAMKPLIDFGSEDQKQRLLPRDRRGRDRRAGDHRTRCRFRRNRHDDPLYARRQRHGGRVGRKNFYQQRRCRRFVSGVRQMVGDRRPARRDLGDNHRERHAGPHHPAHRRQNGAPRRLDRRARFRELPGAPRQSAWAGPARGCPCCSPR